MNLIIIIALIIIVVLLIRKFTSTKNYSGTNQIKQAKSAYNQENKRLISELIPTGKAGNMKYSDTQRIMVIKAPLASYAVKYDSIISVSVGSDTKVVTQTTGTQKRKGVVGRSLVGGIVAGPVGAIVGGTTSKKKINSTSTTSSNTDYWIEITRDDPYFPRITPSYNDQLFYKLQQIVTENESKKASNIKTIKRQATPSVNVADEILKFKNLLDAGAISKEEYQEQKSKLLK